MSRPEPRDHHRKSLTSTFVTLSPRVPPPFLVSGIFLLRRRLFFPFPPSSLYSSYSGAITDENWRKCNKNQGMVGEGRTGNKQGKELYQCVLFCTGKFESRFNCMVKISGSFIIQFGIPLSSRRKQKPKKKTKQIEGSQKLARQWKNIFFSTCTLPITRRSEFLNSSFNLF